MLVSGGLMERKYAGMPSGTDPARDAEADLVRAAQTGLRSAFDQLVTTYATQVIRAAFVILGAQNDAEDIAQETFIAAYRGLGSYHHDAPFGAWLRRIAVNRSYDHLRKRQRQSKLVDEIIAESPWLPVRRGLDHGTPTEQGLLAFPALPPNERMLRLVATRLPLAPKPARPWSLTLTLRRAGQGGAQMSRPVDSGATQHGIRVTVTDVTRSGQTLVVDMATEIRRGPYAGGAVISLAPELATGDFAPMLTIGDGGALTASLSPLSAPVRLRALPRPEFIFQIGPMSAHQVTLTIPAIAVREQASTAITVIAGSRQRVILGRATLGIAARLVAPPAGLGLGDARRLRLTLTFPPASAGGTLHSVSVVVNGLSQQVSRDDPRLDLPLPPGQRAAGITLENPTVAVHGPWTIAMNLQGT